MSWWKRNFGLDLFDTAIHVGVTMMAMVIASSAAGSDEELALASVVGASLLVFAWRRRVALRNQPQETPGERAAVRLEELEARMIELEHAGARIAELEERLDFAERLLAQRSEPAKVGPGGPQ